MNLKNLTDKVLLSETSYWASKERDALVQVLWRLKEIDERKLYCVLKCSSLFDYCVKVLKYSEGQGSRRVNACRLLISMPEIVKDIEKGDLNLTQLCQAKTFFDDEKIKTPTEKRVILEKMKGKTTRECEKILWGLKKEEPPRKVSLTLLEETLDELKKLKALKSHSCPDMDTLLKRMCLEVNKIWDPMLVKRERKVGNGDTRYVQVGVKAEIWKRDQGKCCNCGTTVRLELDHIMPYAAGGKTIVENLRLLCSSCNQRKGVEFFGKPLRAFK